MVSLASTWDGPLCHICKSAATLYTKKKHYVFYRCPSCGLLFLHPLPTPSEAKAFYGEEYFHGKKPGHGYTNYDTDKKPMHAAFLRYLTLLAKYAPEKGVLLDVGTSTGYFLKLAKEEGWNPIGIEISAYAAAVGRTAGLDIRQGTLEEVDLTPLSVSVITAFDVFEHVLDPDLFLERARTLLKTGGLLCINTPTSDSAWARFWGKNWQAILPPEHTLLFNKKNLRMILSESGFEVLQMSKIPKRFTLPYIFRMIYLWRGSSFFLRLSSLASKTFLRSVSIPLNVRDNIFVIAKKK